MIAFRRAELKDLDAITPILTQGQIFLKAQGLAQWQNGYGPGRELAEQDIRQQEGYVLLLNREIVGYAALTKAPDESYVYLSGGEWDVTFERYLSIHRVAIGDAGRGQGLSRCMMTGLLEAAKELQYCDVRIDTHPLNKIMEKVILKAGFVYKGRVSLPIPDGVRCAYQKIMR